MLCSHGIISLKLKGTKDSHKDPADWDRIFMGEITVLKKRLHREKCEIVLEPPSVSPVQMLRYEGRETTFSSSEPLGLI